MELKINIDTQNNELLAQLEKIQKLSCELGRAIRDFEIIQKTKSSATVAE